MKRRGEGGRRGEGIDYWSLCQANAISRIEDSIQGDVNIVPRMNDEFFASLPPPSPPIRIFVHGTIWRTLILLQRVWKDGEKKKKKRISRYKYKFERGRGSKFLSPSRNEIFRSSRNSWLKLREIKKNFIRSKKNLKKNFIRPPRESKGRGGGGASMRKKEKKRRRGKAWKGKRGCWPLVADKRQTTRTIEYSQALRLLWHTTVCLSLLPSGCQKHRFSQ